MSGRSIAAWLADIIEAAENARNATSGMTMDEFKRDWRTRWAIERAVEIVSEASWHLSGEIKARHPEIDWRRVAGIGNVLRHEYHRTAYDVIWRVARTELVSLEAVCREELAAEQNRNQEQ
jgi:uncharacterized protein with HEPN domain